jgi:superfamily II DNA or RNA helicase
VIFDEIHHLGDNQQWELAARTAFERPDVIVLGMSGTPYRTDNKAIPFVDYLPQEGNLRRFRADHTYSLGQSVAEHVCRRPQFHWLNGEVEVSINANSKVYTFYDDVSEEVANLMLRGAVRPGSASRIQALREVISICRQENRKLIIFVGGDSGSETSAITDAQEILPAELISLGVLPREIVSVTSESVGATDAIAGFGESEAWILISVNMVSEGVDIPELSACLFLTSITAKSTTTQRIGRGVRGNNPRSILIFMFRDGRYVELAEEIERDVVEHEIRVRVPKREPEGNGGGGRPQQAQAVGLSAYSDGFTVDGKTYSQDKVVAARNLIQSNNLPLTDFSIWHAILLIEGGNQP